MFRMTDEAGGDDKVLCVPASDVRRDHLRDIADVRDVPAARDRALLHRLQGPRAGQVGRGRHLGRGREAEDEVRASFERAKEHELPLGRGFQLRRSRVGGRDQSQSPERSRRSLVFPACPLGNRPDALIIGAPKAGRARCTPRWRDTRRCTRRRSRNRSTTCAPTRRRRRTAGRATRTASRSGSGARSDYAALFAAAPAGTVRLESTPFYLYLPHARRRIAEELPDAKLVVDRPRPDRPGVLELDAPVGRRARAGGRLRRGLARRGRADRAGWAPFWHYRRMGRYGEQLADLLRPRRPRAGAGAALLAAGLEAGRDAGTGSPGSSGIEEDVGRRPSRRTTPAASSSRACAPRCSAAVDPGRAPPPGVTSRRRSGAGRASPLTRALQPGGPDQRPELHPEQRAALLERCTDDIASSRRCSASRSTTGARPTGRGSFAERVQRSAASYADRGHQVVGAVGAGRLEVEPGTPVGQRDHADVAQGAVAVRRRRDRPVADRLPARRPRSRASPVVSNQLCGGAGPAVVEHGQRIRGEDGGDPGAAGVPASPGVPVSTAPRSVQTRPSALVAYRVTIRSSWPGSVERVAADPHPPAGRPSRTITGSLTAQLAVAGKHHVPTPRRPSAPGSVGIQRLDPPVLRARAWRSSGRAASHRRCGTITGRSNEAAPKASRYTSETGSNRTPSVGAGHHHAHPAALVQRPADPVGQPEDAVDQHTARRPGPVARASGGRRDDHLRVVVAGMARSRRVVMIPNPSRWVGNAGARLGSTRAVTAPGRVRGPHRRSRPGVARGRGRLRRATGAPLPAGRSPRWPC